MSRDELRNPLSFMFPNAKSRLFFRLIFVFSYIFIYSCTDTEKPCLTCPPLQSDITIDTLFVDPTTVALQMVLHRSGTVSLYRDTIEIMHRTQSNRLPDTVFLLDHPLQPNKWYQYQVSLIDSTNNLIDSNKRVTVRTMDTSNHSFIWQTDTLGDGHGSVLYDVAIVNDSVAYVVGEIHKKDSLGQWILPPYNVAKWDGKKWELQRVLYQNGYAPIRCIYANSADDIWFGMGYVVHWDGVKYTSIQVPPFYGHGTSKIWCRSNGEIYLIGDNGVIASSHDVGLSWQQLISGTNVDLLDIYGSNNSNMILVCGYTDFKPTILLQSVDGLSWNNEWIENNPFTFRLDTLSGPLTSLWTPNGNELYISSPYGLYKSFPGSHGQAVITSLNGSWFPGYPHRVRGSGSNDLTIGGDNGMIAHYNGASWSEFPEFRNSSTSIFSLDQKANLIIAAGVIHDPINSRGIVLIGNR